MKQTIALMAMMALLFTITLNAQAQGRGGGQGKGRTTTTGQGGGRTTGQVGRPSGQPRKQPGQGQMDQDRLRAHTTDQQMRQQHGRSNARLHEMDQELNQGKFDRNRIARQSREIEQAIDEWRDQYRKLSQDMGVKP